MDLDRLFIYNLKKCRKNMGISQKELAKKCNAAHSYIRQLESGKGRPSFAFIGKIADALQIEPYMLFYDEMSKPDWLAKTRRLEFIQKNLLATVSSDIQSAFDEMKE